MRVTDERPLFEPVHGRSYARISSDTRAGDISPVAQRGKAVDLSIAGIRLHYWISADPQGSPLILWHGFPSTAYAWRDVAPALAKAGLAVAHYGKGASPFPCCLARGTLTIPWLGGLKSGRRCLTPNGRLEKRTSHGKSPRPNRAIAQFGPGGSLESSGLVDNDVEALIKGWRNKIAHK
jgi:hypothetical protein